MEHDHEYCIESVQPNRNNFIKTEPQIFFPDAQAGPSNQYQNIAVLINGQDVMLNSVWNYDDDNMCVDVLEDVENAELCNLQDSNVCVERTKTTRDFKKASLGLVEKHRFVKTSSALNGIITNYFAKNTNNIQDFSVLLKAIKSDLIKILKLSVEESRIQFYIEVEVIFYTSNDKDKYQIKTLKTLAREIVLPWYLNEEVEFSFSKLMEQKISYLEKSSIFHIYGTVLKVFSTRPLRRPLTPLHERTINDYINEDSCNEENYDDVIDFFLNDSYQNNDEQNFNSVNTELI